MEKLCSYAADFLPDGLYWDPDHDTATVLEKVDPSNDLCESILGLNDYLSTSLRNMHQITKSNLVELKKNHTIKWFHDLPLERQRFVTDFAMKNRGHVKLTYKEEQKQLVEKRQENMLQQKRKKDLQKTKQIVEKEQLSKLHLISSAQEFDQTLDSIYETENLSTSKKNAKIIELLKEQVRIHKKLLNHKINIVFITHGRKRPLHNLIEEVRDIVTQFAP